MSADVWLKVELIMPRNLMEDSLSCSDLRMFSWLKSDQFGGNDSLNKTYLEFPIGELFLSVLTSPDRWQHLRDALCCPWYFSSQNSWSPTCVREAEMKVFCRFIHWRYSMEQYGKKALWRRKLELKYAISPIVILSFFSKIYFIPGIPSFSWS